MTNKKNNKLNELIKVFDEFKNIPFPDGSDDHELSGLHDDLALYDGFVAGCITTIISGGQVQPEYLQFEQNMKTRAEHIIEKGDINVAAQAKIYLDYISRIEQLLKLGLAQK